MDHRKSRRLLALCLLAALVCLAGCGGGEVTGDYPAKTIQVICPWTAGGGTDACVRAFSAAMGRELGQTLKVKNIGRKGGQAGHKAIADAKADGYTLGMITLELATYDDLSLEQFEPLCRVNTDAAAVTVNADWAAANGIYNLYTFIEYCRDHPGEVKMGGSSSASVWHIAGGYLMSAAQIELTMETFDDGAASAVQSAASGAIQGVTVSLSEVRNFLDSKHLVCLGVMDDHRNPAFPNVPTCAEQGYNIQYMTHRGMAAPKGLEPEVKARLEQACAAAIQDEEFLAAMEQNGQTVAYLTAPEYAAFLAEDAQHVQAAMEALGL